METCAGHGRAFSKVVHAQGPLCDILDRAARFANTDAALLIFGETGTGKQILAEAIHDSSKRARYPFVDLNAAAIPETLLESELFGYEEGAFTGATSSKPGRIELADNSTLFLDEIGELPQEAQVKFLKVLDSGKVDRLGGRDSKKVDFRLICATNHDLRRAVGNGTFREDLYYRIKTEVFDLPPLRKRIDDIPVLMQHFVSAWASKSGFANLTVSSEVVDTLQRYGWPGNVREFERAIERAVILADGQQLRPEHLPLEVVMAGPTPVAVVGEPPGPDSVVVAHSEVRKLVYVDDFGDNHAQFRAAIGDTHFLQLLLRSAGMEGQPPLVVETWYPQQVPRDPAALRRKLANVFLLLLDQNYQHDSSIWPNGQILYAYIAKLCSELTCRTLFLTRHAEDDEITVYKDELRRELERDPLFKGQATEWSRAIPTFMIPAPRALPLPERTDPFWNRLRDSLRQCASQYRTQRLLTKSITERVQTTDAATSLATMLQKLVNRQGKLRQFFGRVDASKTLELCRATRVTPVERTRFSVEGSAPRTQFSIIVADDEQALNDALRFAREQLKCEGDHVYPLYWRECRDTIENWYQLHEDGFTLDELDAYDLRRIFKAVLRQLDREQIYWHMEGAEHTPMRNNPNKFIELITAIRSRRARTRATSVQQ